MYFILELLFGIFHFIAYWDKNEDREPKKSTSNVYVAVTVVVILLLVVILIYVNNPKLHLAQGDVV